MYHIKKYLKRFIFSTLAVYSIDYILIKYGFVIPINYFTIVIYTLFGFPGVIVIALLILKYR